MRLECNGYAIGNYDVDACTMCLKAFQSIFRLLRRNWSHKRIKRAILKIVKVNLAIMFVHYFAPLVIGALYWTRYVPAVSTKLTNLCCCAYKVNNNVSTVMWYLGCALYSYVWRSPLCRTFFQNFQENRSMLYRFCERTSIVPPVIGTTYESVDDDIFY